MSKVMFVTGTDTGVGKTHIACLLAKYFSKFDLRVAVMKPFASGSMSDTKKLKKCASITLTEKEITPCFFKTPLAPFAALRMQKDERVDLRRIDRAYKLLLSKCDLLIIEGIGGLCVPIRTHYYIGHWILRHKIPTVIVCHPWLGTLNHTLLTVHYAKTLKISVEGLIINRYHQKSKTVAERSNMDLMEKLTGLPILGNIAYQKKSNTKDHCFDPKWIDKWRRSSL